MAEPDVSMLISVRRAIEMLDSTDVWPRVRRVALSEALGLVLAAEVRADRDDPPFDRSLMDGFAVQSADITGGHTALRLIGEIAAGASAGQAVTAGTCMTIFTGAPMPDGADAVIPVEQLGSRATSEAGGRTVVTLRGEAKAGRFISMRGSACASGQVVLRSGQCLTPAAIAVAASVGAANVDVFARPRVSVLSTGNELVSVDSTPSASQIRNSNSAMLLAMLRTLGCEARDAGMIRDDPHATRAAIQAAAFECDVLLVTGGMSMGDYDFVPRVLLELGAELKITKLKIKPGKPFVFALSPEAMRKAGGATIIFGLPGNPVAVFTCMTILCSRILRRMRGQPAQARRFFRSATLAEAVPANGPREFYQPAVIESDGRVRPLEWKSSADLHTLALADVLLVREENDPARAAGSVVQLIEYALTENTRFENTGIENPEIEPS